MQGSKAINVTMKNTQRALNVSNDGSIISILVTLL